MDTASSHIAKPRHPRAHPLPDFAASEAQMRRELLAASHREAWEATLGSDEYAELRRLALAAARRRRRRTKGPRVLILPGIMGSKLGIASRANPLLWIDPEEIHRGRLLSLALPAGKRFKPVGVMVLSYLKLKLTLEIAGFDASFYPYDWRQGIDVLGRELSEVLQREKAPSVALVAHSMGGLVSRVAISLLGSEHAAKVSRVVMLATPNYGSFAPVLALRGVYPAVRKVATLDPRHSAETLTRKVFSTFPGLHHMLPAPERFSDFDLYDPAAWPSDQLAPRRTLLRSVAGVRQLLAPADERFAVIVGVNQETVTGIARTNGAFEYHVTRNGDSTVPVDMARLPDAQTYYVEENHASLPANGRVCSGVTELLTGGSTGQLARNWTHKPGARAVSESALRQLDVQKYDWARLTPQERHDLLQGLVLPVPTKQ